MNFYDLKKKFWKKRGLSFWTLLSFLENKKYKIKPKDEKSLIFFENFEIGWWQGESLYSVDWIGVLARKKKVGFSFVSGRIQIMLKRKWNFVFFLVASRYMRLYLLLLRGKHFHLEISTLVIYWRLLVQLIRSLVCSQKYF